MSSLTRSTFQSPFLPSSTRSSLPSLVATWLSLLMFLAIPPTPTTLSLSTPLTRPSRTPPSPSRSRTTKIPFPYPLSALTTSPRCFLVRPVRPSARVLRSLSSLSRTARLHECGPTRRSFSTRRLLSFPSPYEPSEFKSAIYDIVKLVE